MAVQHHEGAMADALGGERLGEIGKRRQREAELGLCIGQLATEIEKGGAWDVALVVVGAATLSVVTAFGPRPQIGRAVEDTQCRGAQAAREFLGRNQRSGLRHGALPWFGRATLSVTPSGAKGR